MLKSTDWAIYPGFKDLFGLTVAYVLRFEVHCMVEQTKKSNFTGLGCIVLPSLVTFI